MSEQCCFIFRTDPNDFVRDELERGCLRQGWSPPDTSLLNVDGETRDAEEWEQAYQDQWGEPPSPRRLGILRRMLDMKEGDLVFCPKTPDSERFTIATVSSRYRFEIAPNRDDDFGHIIPVENQRVVSNWHDLHARTITELFKSAYSRPAVTRVQDYKNEQVLYAAKQLLKQENTHVPQDRAEIKEQHYADGRRKAAEFLMKCVQKEWGFDQFEAAVGEAFKQKGYEFIRSKSAKNGGDADHVFALPMPGFDDALLDRTPLVIVQVKHKHGVDSDDVHGVNQLVNWKSDEGEEVRFKVLFSSADSFTENCKKIADANDVILICDIQAGLFML